MTVVAAFRDPEAGIVHLAADSASTGGPGGDIVTPVAKIRRLKVADQHAVIGVAGRMALLPLIQRNLKQDTAPDLSSASDCDDWAQATAEAITDIAAEHGLTEDGSMQGGALLAFGPWLWEIGDHLALPIASYMAIGSGAPCAMGAMWASHKVLPPADVARSGVAAAIDHMDGIVGPILGMRTEALPA